MRAGDILVIQSLDRLGRNYNEMLDEWRMIVRRKKADIRVLDMPILDTTAKTRGLIGKFIAEIVLQLLSFVAENERRMIHERQRQGIAAAQARGVRFGRPKRILPENFTDHADAGTFDGTNWINLAFTPVFDVTNKVRVADWFLRAKARGWIKYATALDEASFADAPLMTDFRYRDGHGTNDIDKGWVWLTIPMPDERPALTNRLWKIYVDDTADTTARN